MDASIAYIIDGKMYNRSEQELIKCELCGGLTTMLGTKLCNRCWELKHRIESDAQLTIKALKNMKLSMLQYLIYFLTPYKGSCDMKKLTKRKKEGILWKIWIWIRMRG